MTEVTTDNSSPEKVSPGIEAPLLGMGDQAHFQRYQRNSNKVLWGIFFLLLVLVAGVFFVLPTYVTPPEAAATNVVVVPTAAPGAAPVAIAPFEEAQRLRQRETAQNTLAALLELQEELENKQVLNWAEAQFTDGLNQARSGDEAYRQQQFIDANAFYQAGLEALQRIKDSEPEFYARFLAEGDAAILAGAAATADRAYSQALLIDPGSNEAVAGMERATVLNQVLALLNEGRSLQADEQLEAARDLYRQAQAIDSAHVEVGAALQQVNSAIAERDFAAAMSRGYAALQGGDPEAAQRSFAQALAMKPGSAEVAAAMQQARDQQTFTAISVHITAAGQHEADEAWEQALAAWNEALAIDPNLVSAQEGRMRTQGRVNLDRFLESTLADPLRVAEDNIFEQTLQVVAEAERLPDIGPRLQNQLQQVRGFLARAKVPVSVQLQSDGMTTVTVYRVGELGLFTSQTLSLVPGAYTAVGVRPGYRDVREEFVVSIDGQAPVVSIACSEAI